MQTFLCEPDFVESAKCLDYRRLGKQRIEAKQILEINYIINNPKGYMVCPNGDIHDNFGFCPICGSIYYKSFSKWRSEGNKIKWENHPAVLMWRGYELALAYYGSIICREWISRGYKDTLLSFFDNYCEIELHKFQPNINFVPNSDDISNFAYNNFEYFYESPNWVQDKLELYKVIQSHRSNLLRKDYNYYSKFNWKGVDSNLPYYWPVKKEE